MGKSFVKSRAEFGFITYNGVYIALASDYEKVEDFEFDGITTDVVRAEGVDEEQREYEVFWRPKRHKMTDGKLKGNVHKGVFNFLEPLTCRRTDWKQVK